MANWSILKAAIADVIRTNGNQEITGQVLQSVLTNIVNALGERPDFAGIATPTTAPDMFDGPIFFIAATPGTYPSFNNITLAQGEIAILRYDENTWVKESLLEAATKADLVFVVNLGTFDRAGDAEELAASYADNRNVILMYFKISNVRSGFFLQSFSNTSATIQFYYLGGRRYVRQVSWGSGSIGSWVDVTGSERIQKLVYDEYNHTIKFKDALGDADWGGVQLPIASKETYIPGLVGAETLMDLELVKDRTLNEIPPYSGEIENADIVLQGTSTPSAIVYVKSKGVFAAKSGDTYYSAWPSTSLFPAQEAYNEGVTVGETYAIPRKLYYLQARDTSTLNSGLRYFDGSSFIEIANADEVNMLNKRVANNTTNIAANTEELATKAPKVGYAPDLKVDFAKELVGRGVAEPQEIGTIRPTGVISIGDGNATIEKVKGKSVVWNQFLKLTPQKTSSNGIEMLIDEEGVVTVNGVNNGTSSTFRLMGNIRQTIGHKMMLVGSNNMGGWNIFTINESSSGSTDVGSKGYTIFTATKDGVNINLSVWPNVAVDNVVFKPRYYDLTKIFGAGNEPTTIEEFEARRPLGVTDDYNEGEIISYDAQELKSVGFNAWDEEWELGTIAASNGVYVDSTTRIRSKNYCACVNANYKVNTTVNVSFYDGSKKFISTQYPSAASTITPPSNARYFRLAFPESYGTTYKNDICIHLVHTGYRNGEYQPYEEDTLQLPNIKAIKDKDGNQLFPNGLLSAGSVYDEVTERRAIKRIGARAYTSADDADASVVTDGKNTHYALAEPIEVDLEEPLNLTYDAWDFGTEELIAEGKTTPLNADIVYQFNAVDRIRENSEHATEANEKVGNLQKKQLNLSVKDNGNIVLSNANGESKEFMPATPSGDPMHYAYEALGAVWNATTGYWKLGTNNAEGEWMGLSDLTNEDMRRIILSNPSTTGIIPRYGEWCSPYIKGRVIIAGMSFVTGYDMALTFRQTSAVIIFNICSDEFVPQKLVQTFYNSSSLKYIPTTIRCSNLTSSNNFNNAFTNCPSLEYVRLNRLKISISMESCVMLSKDSVKYMIDKAEPTSAITITLHHDCYERVKNDADILASLATQPLVTLVDASAT